MYLYGRKSKRASGANTPPKRSYSLQVVRLLTNTVNDFSRERRIIIVSIAIRKSNQMNLHMKKFSSLVGQLK